MDSFSHFLIYGYAQPPEPSPERKKNPPTFSPEKMASIAQASISTEDKQIIRSLGRRAKDVTENPYLHYTFENPDEYSTDTYQSIIDAMMEHEKRILWLEGFYSRHLHRVTETCANCGKRFKQQKERSEFCSTACKKVFYSRV